MCESDAATVGVLSCSLLLFISIFLIAYSFSIFAPGEVAILYDANLLHVKSDQVCFFNIN